MGIFGSWCTWNLAQSIETIPVFDRLMLMHLVSLS